MGYFTLIFPILVSLICTVKGLPRVDPLVNTDIGLIRGLTSVAGDYSMFLGIPYATVNVTNPFGPSIPHAGFEDTFDAFDDSAICPQIEEFNKTITGNLDCLHLNVYVPSTATSRNRLPVLVWIYGGGFSIGFAGRYLYGPEYLLRHDVILVTLNYRLGPYGFMCLETPDVPGNQGIKDQLTALRWIKNHIESFGGDSKKITLFGESAGGVSVDLLYLYTQENLFHNIILQSGTSFLPTMSDSDPDFPIRLSENLGFAPSDLNEALSFLGTVEPNLIIAATAALDEGFGPCVEKEFDNVERLITDYPINVNVASSDAKPILLGFTSDEGNSNDISDLSLEIRDVIRNELSTMFEFEEEYLKEMIENVHQFYNGNENFNGDAKRAAMDLKSDFMFIYPTYRAIQKYFSDSSKAKPIYHYMFSHVGDINFVRRKNNITEGGAAHADEISYLFDVSIFKEKPSEEDQLIIDRMTTLWTNFAKYSNPTPEITDLLPIEWPAVTEDSLNCYNIDLELEVIQRPFHDRVAYLNLFFKLNEKHLKGFREN